MRKSVWLVIVVAGLIACAMSAYGEGASYSDERGQHHYVPEQGFVPDAETAIKIAEAVWLPIYGEETLKDERPFQAVLKDDVWRVKGFLPEYMLGGVAEAEIRKQDGAILRVSHGQ